MQDRTARRCRRGGRRRGASPGLLQQGDEVASAGDSRRAERRTARIDKLPRRVGLFLLVCALGALMTVAVLEIQASATAYIVGENHWSKAQQRALHDLDRYLVDDDAVALARAREALRVPLGDRQARLALERDPVDTAAARAGFLQGGNAPGDIERLIWMHRLFARAPYFSEAIEQWRLADRVILEMAALIDRIEEDSRLHRLTAARRDEYRAALRRIEGQSHGSAFLEPLVEGTHRLRQGLVALSLTVFVMMTMYALMLMRRTLRHVRETESEFRVAFSQAVVGMLKLDREGRLRRVNEAFARLLGYRPDQLLALRLADLLHPDDLCLDGQGDIDWIRMCEPGDRRLRHRDGGLLWVRWTASMIVDVRPGSDRIFVVVEDVSQARELADEIAHQASHDELTGLINRREIERRLVQAIHAVHRGAGPHALCFVDLDQFKVLNDTCGHAAGDHFLREFSATLDRQLRDGDWVGRLGGDEFAIFLQGAGLDDAERAAQRLHAILGESTFHWGGRRFPLGCSIGVAEINVDAVDTDSLLRAADTACYLAKEEGRNRVRCYRDADRAIARRRNELEWVAQTQLAIAEDRLLLYAQRIQSLRGENRLQYEILVRLAGEEGQVVPPGFFLPAMERYGQAPALDRHVLASVLAQIGGQHDHLADLDLCHINLSAQSIADPAFREHACEMLDAQPALARRICFEITETAVIANLADARVFIDQMRARGCRIALDDFGSGLSSFGYLKSLPVDILKIDGAFVRDLDKDDVDLALVRSMVQVGRALGKTTIAEWVETEAAMARLAEVGVDYVQGYALHAPCPLAELIGAWAPVAAGAAEDRAGSPIMSA